MRCKFWKECKWYSPISETCNKTGGMYYGKGRPAGCYRKNQLKIGKIK